VAVWDHCECGSLFEAESAIFSCQFFIFHSLFGETGLDRYARLSWFGTFCLGLSTFSAQSSYCGVRFWSLGLATYLSLQEWRYQTREYEQILQLILEGKTAWSSCFAIRYGWKLAQRDSRVLGGLGLVKEVILRIESCRGSKLWGCRWEEVESLEVGKESFFLGSRRLWRIIVIWLVVLLCDWGLNRSRNSTPAKTLLCIKLLCFRGILAQLLGTLSSRDNNRLQIISIIDRLNQIRHLPKLEFPSLFYCDVDLGDMHEAGDWQQTFPFHVYSCVAMPVNMK
jgi:hypothetical protein